MIDELKIMLSQLNPTVGALSGNAGLAREAYDTAAKAGADLLVFPELFISGYPPEDLVLKPAFVAACMAQVRELGARASAHEHDLVAVGDPEQRLEIGDALVVDGLVDLALASLGGIRRIIKKGHGLQAFLDLVIRLHMTFLNHLKNVFPGKH